MNRSAPKKLPSSAGADADATVIQMPATGGTFTHATAAAAAPTAAASPLRSKYLKIGVKFSIVLSFMAVIMYVNVLNSMPEFVDEAGNSTIEVSA